MSFASLIGNTNVKHVIAQFLINKKLPDAMIFSGPRGAQKLQFALTLGKNLFCLDKQDDCCDQCRNCKSIDRSLFLDVQIVSPEGQFYKKSQIDDIIGSANLKPAYGDKKLTIFRDAHKMNDNSANAFLKTLEEPSAANIFILLTSNLRGILPTIQSRCHILRFSTLTKKEVAQRLYGFPIEPSKISFLAYCLQDNLDDVSMPNILELENKRDIALSILTRLLRSVEVEDILLDFYDRSRDRDKFIEYFREIVHLISILLRDIMILMIDRVSETIICEDFRETLMALCKLLTIDKVFSLIDRMELLLRDIQRNLNTRVLILEFIHSFSGGYHDYV